MCPFRFPATPTVFSLLLGALLAVSSCGGDSGPATPTPPDPRLPDPDTFTLSVAGGPETTYTEGSGTTIDCDPRIDWYFSQVHLYANYTNGSGPNGYDYYFGILFPFRDGVGTYTVHDDSLYVSFQPGPRYIATPLVPTADGTVVVTRSDDRIEGTFNMTLVEYPQQSTTTTVTGRFNIDSGYSNCP